MQAINDNDNQDPIQELPNEMFTSILSLLPPSSIAHSSAASRSWRASILSSPRLYQEIDLTKLKEDQDLLPITYHFVRLSFLSLNRLTKVSLNMTPFLRRWIENEYDGPAQRFKADDIILTTLQQSQRTLREITLLLDGPGWSWESEIDILPFLLQLLRSMSNLTSLKSIWLEAPIWFSLKAGNSGGKMITVLNKRDKLFNIDFGLTDSKLIAEFMQEVKSMSDSGITEFLPRPCESWDEEESPEILKELLDCFLMEKLDASWFSPGVDGKDLWRFVLQLQNLNYLDLFLVGDEGLQDENARTLQAPQGTRTAAKLTYLRLSVSLMKVDWKSISKWAGVALEDLHLELDSQSIKGCFSLITDSTETLKELHIGNEWSENSDDIHEVVQQDSIGIKLFFPNLEKLRLQDVKSFIFQCLSNSEFCKLQNLTIIAEDPSIASSGFDCLMRILARYASKIVDLKFIIKTLNSFQSPWSNFNFCFLKGIRIGRLSEVADTDVAKLPRWILMSLYPKLTSMGVSNMTKEQSQEIVSTLKSQGNAPKLKIE